MADPVGTELDGLRPDLASLVIAQDVERLIAALADEVAGDVTEALALVGERAVGPLRDALESDDPFVSGWAAIALAKLGDEGADERLVMFVQDYDYSNLPDRHFFVWEEAVAVLGDRRVKEAVEPLIALLRHRDTDIRQEAAAALGQIGDHRAVDPLIRILLEEDVAAIIPECWEIEEALTVLGGERAEQAVAKWQAREQQWLRQTDLS